MPIYGFDRGQPVLTPPVTDFDKDQQLPLKPDNIDLAVAATIIRSSILSPPSSSKAAATASASAPVAAGERALPVGPAVRARHSGRVNSGPGPAAPGGAAAGGAPGGAAAGGAPA